MRFFFDYMTEDRKLLDYRGEEFQTPSSAIDFAEAIVDVLKHSISAEWIGWSVEVRNAEGKKFLTLPVGPPELKAA